MQTQNELSYVLLPTCVALQAHQPGYGLQLLVTNNRLQHAGLSSTPQISNCRRQETEGHFKMHSSVNPWRKK